VRGFPIVPFVVAATLGGAGPARAASQGAAVMPVTVDGEINEGWRNRLERDMVDGLSSSGVAVIGPAEVTRANEGETACRDAACYATLSATLEAPLVLRAHVKLEGRDYHVYVEAIDGADGSLTGSAEDDCRMCGLTEVGELLAAKAGELHDEFYRDETAPPDAAATAVADDPPPEGRAPRDKRPLVVREWMPPAGWALVGVGVASLAAGATFLALHHRPYESQCSGSDVDAMGNCRRRYDTIVHGGALAGLGGAMLVTGATFLIVHAIARKRSSQQTTAVSHRVRALLQGRF
jgi:hypothetical protein